MRECDGRNQVGRLVGCKKDHPTPRVVPNKTTQVQDRPPGRARYHRDRHRDQLHLDDEVPPAECACEDLRWHWHMVKEPKS